MPKACCRIKSCRSSDNNTLHTETRAARLLEALDGTLCPSLIDDLTAEDMSHNIYTDNSYLLFPDYKYLVTRDGFSLQTHNILELTMRPDSDVMPTESFQFCGYDIMGSGDSVSVLLNCGEFPDILSPNDTNSFGLLDSLAEADRIANDIRRSNPNEYHCRDCSIWGIAKYENV